MLTFKECQRIVPQSTVSLEGDTLRITYYLKTNKELCLKEKPPYFIDCTPDILDPKDKIFCAPLNDNFEVDYSLLLFNSKPEKKLLNNLCRARSSIRGYALCNPWEYFVTCTVDPGKYDRFDLKSFYKTLSKWLNNYKTKYPTFAYILIPELHKNGAFHFHGLLNGVPDSDIKNNKNGYPEWVSYSKKFGFTSVSKVKNHNAVSIYITKYITKDISSNLIGAGSHLYYCSKGLNKPNKVVVNDFGIPSGFRWDYESPVNGYKVLTLDKNNLPMCVVNNLIKSDPLILKKLFMSCENCPLYNTLLCLECQENELPDDQAES